VRYKDTFMLVDQHAPRPPSKRPPRDSSDEDESGLSHSPSYA